MKNKPLDATTNSMNINANVKSETRYISKRRPINLLLCAGLLALVGFLAGLETVKAALSAEREQWTLLGQGSTVVSGGRYTFHNTKKNWSLRYGKTGTAGGINLKWSSDKNLRNFQIISTSGKNSPIKYGDPVAIRVEHSGKNTIVKYDKRTFGINLNWSLEPVYEWIITGGPKGQVVKTNTQIGLINLVEQDYLVHGKRPGRPTGLRWYTDYKYGKWGGVKDALRKAAKKVVIETIKAYLAR